MKKLTSVVLLSFMLMCIFSVVPVTATSTNSGEFKFDILKDGTAKITKYTGSEETLTIPEKLNGYTVTKLGADWYSENTKVLNLPSTLTEYYELGGNKLSAINVDANNKKFSSIDGVLFDKKASELLQFPGSKTNGTYNIPDGVTAITASAFEGANIKGVNFPNTVTKIGNYAFYSCKNLESVKIPDKIKIIGNSTFSYCKKLKNVSLNTSLKEIGMNGFSHTNISSIKFNNGLERIGYNAFSNTKISSVKLPDTLEYLSGFSNTEITKVDIPASVKTLGEDCFYGCNKLKTVTLHNGIEKISKYAFYNCKSLKSIKIPPTVKRIEGDVFYKTGIKRLMLPKALTYLATQKTTENVFPSSLEKLSISKNNKTFSTKNGVLYNKKRTKLLYYPNSRGLKTYKTPNSVRVICKGAFNGAKISKVIVSSNVKQVQTEAFAKSKTKTVVLKKGIKTIDTDTFFNSKVKKVTLPSTVTKISDCAFYASSLKWINIPNSVRSIGERAFFGADLGKITVPSSVKKIGKEAIGIIYGPYAYNGGVNKNTIIRCKYNSVAYEYAKKNKIKYEIM